MRVFVVEDDQVLLLMLKRMVGRMGFELCGTAVTGKDAIEQISELRPELIFMDIMLKDNIDGVTVAEKISSLYSPKVIYITGNSDPYFKGSAEKIGYHDYLIKPVSFEMIRESVNRIESKQSMSDKESAN